MILKFYNIFVEFESFSEHSIFKISTLGLVIWIVCLRIRPGLDMTMTSALSDYFLALYCLEMFNPIHSAAIYIQECVL